MKKRIIFIFIILLMITGCTSSDWKIKARKNLEQNENELLEVIELVKNEKLEQNYGTLHKIPDKYSKLTKDGLIVVYQNDDDGVQIGFYVFRGMQTGSCYLMYSSGGEDMIKKNESGHPIIQIENFDGNWYYVETDY